MCSALGACVVQRLLYGVSGGDVLHAVCMNKMVTKLGVYGPGGGICSSNGFTHLQSLSAASCFTFHYTKLWRLHSMCMSFGVASAAAASARVAVLGCLQCGMGSVKRWRLYDVRIAMKMTSAAKLECCSGSQVSGISLLAG
jgi:hypothetical protein